jgi:hypothetical protein
MNNKDSLMGVADGNFAVREGLIGWG